MPTSVQIYLLSSEPGGRASLSGPSPVPTGWEGAAYTRFTTFAEGGGSYLAAYGGSKIDLYRVRGESPWLTPVGSVATDAGWDLLDSFLLANVAHLVLYSAARGTFRFFPLTDAMASPTSYAYTRTHAPAATKGFTEVKSFVLAGGIVFLAYSFDTGAVALYSVTSTSTSPLGAPPIVANYLWDHVWAPGWTRFAFFRLGAGNFFLKTNTKYPNVNIDHILDVPANGTAEVATHMDLDDARALTIVEPFYLPFGDPHFVAYKPDGTTTLYRIHSDCQGWTAVGSASTVPDATAIVPVQADGKSLLLVLSEAQPT